MIDIRNTVLFCVFLWMMYLVQFSSGAGLEFLCSSLDLKILATYLTLNLLHVDLSTSYTVLFVVLF